MPANRSLRVAAVLASSSCVALAGCVSESTSGTGSTFKFEWWIPTLITLVSLISVVSGGLMMKNKKKGGWVFALAGVFGLIFGVGMFTDKAVVDDDHFDLNTGLIISPTTHSIRFDDVTSITGTSEEKSGRRGSKKTSFYLNFQMKSGGSEKVPLGDLMKKGPIDKVLAVAAKRGIPVSGVFPE